MAAGQVVDRSLDPGVHKDLIENAKIDVEILNIFNGKYSSAIV